MKKSILLFVAIISLGNLIFGQVATSQSSINGLRQEAIVSRDSRGIPYIDAKNEPDLYFAQGYVTASDRLWQMDLLRRVSRGELAGILGKQVLDEDKQWRRYGFSGIAEETLKTMNPDLKAALENYAKGVNAYIATLDASTLPAEFKILQYKPSPWKPTDTICLGKILAEALSSTWENDLIRASFQKLPKQKIAELTSIVTPDDVVLFGKDTTSVLAHKYDVPAFDATIAKNMAEKFVENRKKSLSLVGLYAEDLAASNNWVVSGKRTLDGKPLLANDPHLQAAAPGIWYLTHLSSPTVQAAGVTFPGVPGIILGHNASIAWGATNVGPDVQDLYVETVNEKGEYKTPTGWAKPRIRKEQIKVRKVLTSPETEIENLEVVETRNGVIIEDEIKQKFALKWTARNPDNNEFEAFYFLNRAKNFEDFKGSLKRYGGSTQNFIYADVKGNIGWIAAGRIPIRKIGDGSLPYDGSTTDGDWTGMIPFDELPQLYNPPEGFIITANQRIVGTSYKYQQISRDVATPWRARRIYDRLKSNSKVSINDMGDIQRDVFSLPFSRLNSAILRNGNASNETLTVLRGWDGKMTADSKAALLVNGIRNCAAEKVAADNAPVPGWVIRERLLDRIVRENSALWLPKGFASFGEVLKTCDGESRANLAKRFGADDSKWVWGSVWKSNYPHPLAIVPLIGGQFKIEQVGINGSGTTPNVGSSVSMRLIATPGNWDETRHAIPLGQSGNPQSPHWKDSWSDWNSGKPQVFPFTKAAVTKAAVETMIMKPNREE
jgi:penicillin G amidase